VETNESHGGSGEQAIVMGGDADAVYALHCATLPAAESRSLTREQRLARGKAAREALPRAFHATWRPAANRQDPVEVLRRQAQDRLIDVVPIRHGRMLASPFAFLRGSAAIMAADLAGTPATGLLTQLCGDAHLANFGLFASPERRLLFDINDFDETLPGPWEWDVKRLAASFEVAGRERGYAADDRRDIVTTAVRAYREGMARSTEMPVLDVWYDHITSDDVLAAAGEATRRGRLSQNDRNDFEEAVAKARTRGHRRAFGRLATEVDGELRISPGPPLIQPLRDLPGIDRAQMESWMGELVRSYRHSLADHFHPLERFQWVDAALKVVGVGSAGKRVFILLFTGDDNNDALFLQVKEAHASALEAFAGRGCYDHHGQRIVAGQRLMQAASDIFLGWVSLRGPDGVLRDYYVQQLHDWKGAVDLARLEADGAEVYAELCGATLARAHARAGERFAIAAYLGRGDQFDEALAAFARVYADQTERDYEALQAAVKSGSLPAEMGL
jgi:uncharacterized protein (DUF2252 family)